MIVAGIDPGVSGAVAIIGPDELGVVDLPVADGRVDPVALGEILRGTDRVAIEDNKANGRNGSLANFSMGLSIGLCTATVQMLGIPLYRVRPVDWQRALGLATVATSERKDASRARARELFPSTTAQLKRKADHNRAEALLIMEWARRQP